MSITQRKPQLGLTLIESLVSLAVLSILLLQALPAFSAFLDQNRRRSLANDLVSSLRYAHTEAIRRGQRVAVCKTATGASCNTGTDRGWETGWLTFLDANRNGTLDANETVLHQHRPEAVLWRIHGSQPVSKVVSFNAWGQGVQPGGACLAGTCTVCHPSAQIDTGSEIVLSISGRIRSQQITAQNCPT